MAHKLKLMNKKFTTSLDNKNKTKSFTTPRLFNNYQFKSAITDTDAQEYEINDLYSREDDEISDDASADNDVVEIQSTDNAPADVHKEESLNSADGSFTEMLQIQNECAICKLIFSTQHELVRHAHENHPNARAFKCRNCKTVFSKIESVPLHFKAVHGSAPRPEACEYCSRSFFTKYQLEKHKKSHSEERPFSCDQCEKNYKYQRNLLVHKKTHIKQKSEVNTTNNSDNEYTNANATNEEEEDLTVNYDGEGYKYLEDTSIANEMDVNNSEYTYFIIDEFNTDTEENTEIDADDDDDVIFEDEWNKADDQDGDDSYLKSATFREVDQNECGVCLQIFNCQQAVYKHVHQEHPDTEIFKCPYCDDNFYRHEMLAEHVTIHSHLQKKNVCPQCFKSFDRGNDLRRHQLTHSDKRPFLCEICNKGFKQRNHLKRHQEILHEKKSQSIDYKCTLCPRKFNCPDILKQHIDSHNKKVDYSCSTCNKSFKSSLDLEQHEQLHNHHKRFKCGFCSKSYDTNASLHRHFLSHSNTRNFSCSMCNRSFKERSHLKGHERTHYT